MKIFVSPINAHAKESIPEIVFKKEIRQDDVSGCELASLLSSLVPEMVATHGPNIMESFPPKHLRQWLLSLSAAQMDAEFSYGLIPWEDQSDGQFIALSPFHIQRSISSFSLKRYILQV